MVTNTVCPYRHHYYPTYVPNKKALGWLIEDEFFQTRNTCAEEDFILFEQGPVLEFYWDEDDEE